MKLSSVVVSTLALAAVVLMNCTPSNKQATTENLIGKNWVLERAESLPIPDGLPTALKIKVEPNLLTGNTICNTISAKNTIDNNGKFSIENLVATERACEEKAFNEFDMHYVRKLEKISGWKVKDGKLLLMEGDIASLIYTREK